MNKKTYLKKLIIAAITLITASTLTANNKDILSNIKFKGDLRLRYQTEKKDSTDTRNRYRLRLRLAGKSELSKKSKIKFGLATGADDPRSTNQTFQDTFQTPDIRLDYAFITHKLSKNTQLFSGKMNNPLYRPSDLLWDSDIKPEGVAIKFQNKTTNIKWFITGGFFILDEIKDSTKDPYLLALQPGINWNLTNKIKSRSAISFYTSHHLKGTTLAHSANTNTTDSSGLEKEFSTIAISTQIDFKEQFSLPLIRAFGELIINTNQNSSNQGGIAGIKFGDKKIKDAGTWQSEISYRYLATDAWIDAFPDSDSYGGATNIEGLEFIIKYGLSKKSSLGIDIYSMDVINGTKNNQTVIQLDINTKF
jgi:hypothetical protein